MTKTFKYTIESPVGYLEINTTEDALISVSFIDILSQSADFLPSIMNDTILQLKEYFKGERKEFDLKLETSGTEFQLKVWEQVKKIPFGETVSYLDIASLTGSKNNTRAVGLANGKNPIPIIIPCHRVIGTNGKLTGYAGGLEIKKWLLQHELQNSSHSNLLF